MFETHSVFSQKQNRTLSKDLPTPLYFQLYSLLKSDILDGRFTNGSQLPTEGQLSAKFGVSRITSKRALDELAREGLVERYRGRGTHVTHESSTEPAYAPMVGLVQEIASIGKSSTATVLNCAMKVPPRAVANLLGLADKQKILHLSRFRHRDGVRFGYYRSWTKNVDLPEDPEVMKHTPRMSYFRDKGLNVSFIKQTLTACTANAKAAAALDVERGSPLLSLTRLSFESRLCEDYPVDYLRVLYHPERFEYRIDLELDVDL
jgi:GntR family transcriptional regulator